MCFVFIDTSSQEVLGRIYNTCDDVRNDCKCFPLTTNTLHCGFVWVWNLVADIEGGKEAEGVWEHGAKENIWT